MSGSHCIVQTFFHQPMPTPATTLGQGHQKAIQYISPDLYFHCHKYVIWSSKRFWCEKPKLLRWRQRMRLKRIENIKSPRTGVTYQEHIGDWYKPSAANIGECLQYHIQHEFWMSAWWFIIWNSVKLSNIVIETNYPLPWSGAKRALNERTSVEKSISNTIHGYAMLQLPC